MATLSLSAVDGLWWESDVALSANHLLTLELSSEGSKIWLNFHLTHTSSSKSEDEMESGLLLDVVVGEGSAIFELLTSEDKSLLIGRDTFLVLDLGLDVFDGICWLNIEGDGLSCEGLDENLHLFLVDLFKLNYK